MSATVQLIFDMGYMSWGAAASQDPDSTWDLLRRLPGSVLAGDSPRSLRGQVHPTYKQARVTPTEETLRLRVAAAGLLAELRRDHLLTEVDGLEADDIVALATSRAQAAFVIGEDKDFLQLPWSVTLMKRSGAIWDETRIALPATLLRNGPWPVRGAHWVAYQVATGDRADGVPGLLKGVAGLKALSSALHTSRPVEALMGMVDEASLRRSLDLLLLPTPLLARARWANLMDLVGAVDEGYYHREAGDLWGTT